MSVQNFVMTATPTAEPAQLSAVYELSPTMATNAIMRIFDAVMDDSVETTILSCRKESRVAGNEQG